MRKAIAVIGTALGKLSGSELKKAEEVGAAVADSGCVLLTGACRGLPLAAARGANAKRGFVIGVSPADSKLEHVKKYAYPLDVFDLLLCTGFGYKGRNVVLVRGADAVIALKGGMGTLNELTIAYDENKVLGILEGVGGVSEMLPEILERVERRTKAIVFSDSSPAALVKKVVSALANHNESGEDAVA